ncbi:LOW QUALITY PROTEIN: RING finger protein 17-like [Thalassophryne amazonica]|uniref:LOW QUALITY PROTEIN: RING finger protein 17-like n=1 Tax=Thalassophryne amazonica TaxID=390379 RepID=UPI001470DA74|nr:LOW QUALITY PROTEIN: RING finger protein 17-like [Thalassophryne amazonica]
MFFSVITHPEPGSKTKPLPIKMFESSLSGPQANIAALLVKEELVCFKQRGAAKDQKCQNDEPVMWDPPLYVSYGTEGVSDGPDQMVSGDEEQSEFQPQLQVPAVFKNLKVRITHINSPSSFFVQLTKYDSRLKRICELLKQEYANAEPQDIEWEADMYCAAHINDVWERGQICSTDTVSKTAQAKAWSEASLRFHVSVSAPLSWRDLESVRARPAGGLLTWTATACDFICYYLIGASAVMTIKLENHTEMQYVSTLSMEQRGRSAAASGLSTSKRVKKCFSSSAIAAPPSAITVLELKWVGSGCAVLQPTPRPESDITLPQQYLDLFSHPGFLVSLYPETFVNSDIVKTKTDVGGKWHGDGMALLKELLLGRYVDMVVKKDTLMPADGFLDEWDLDTKDLWNLEEPTLGPFIKPQLPSKGEELPVKLYLWPLVGSYNMEINGETLNEALSRINRDISSLPRLTNFPPGKIPSFFGGPCLAEYSDGIYYRAKLMKFTSMELVTLLVQHVDFGSDDTLPTSKLRQMPAELLRFPVQALRVHLMGFKPPAVRPQEDVLPYSPRWSMKAVIDTVDLLHGTITASVVAQEPELKVLLYKDGELIHLPLVKSGLAELDCTGV